MSQSDSEELVFLRRAHGDADRLGRSEAVQRADDDPLPLQTVEQLPAAANVREEEVAPGWPDRLQPVAAEDLGQPVAARRVQLPPPRDLLWIFENVRSTTIRRPSRKRSSPST